MTRRMLYSSMYKNEKFSRMPLGARFLQIGMLNHADDQGRLKANPNHLRGDIFPDDEEITGKDVQKWLDLMYKNGTIILYTVDEKQYAQFINWWKYQSLQYAQPSEYPRPEGWQDRIRKTATKGLIVTCNWYTVGDVRLTDTCDQDGKPLPPKQPSRNGSTPQSPMNPPVSPSVDSGDYSGESTGDYPGEHTILTKLEDQLEDRGGSNTSRARVTEQPQQPQPPPLSSKQPTASTGDPLMDAASNRFKQKQVDGHRKASRSGAWPELDKKVPAAVRLPLVERLIDMHGLRAAIDVAEDDYKLADMHRLAADLYVMGFTTIADIETVYAQFKKDWKGKTPAGRQLATIASNMKQQPGQSPPIKAVLPLGKWCLQKYGVDRPMFVPDVSENIIYEQYEQYKRQYQQAH